MTFRSSSPDQFVPTIYAEEAYGKALTVGSSRTWSICSDSLGLWQLPLVLAPIAEGGFEAYSPYGYPGIYADPALSATQVNEKWIQTIRLLRDAEIVSLFLRFPPYAYPGSGVDSFAGLNLLDIESKSKTIEVETLDSEKVWSNMTGRARTAVRKARKLGMKAEACPASLASLGPDSAFRMLYGSTMNRLGASNNHYYGPSYYSELLTKLGDRIFMFNVFAADGKPAASAMILLDDRVVHYHLSGSDPEAARNGANNLLLWTILEWSALQGFPSVHLGGGVLPEDSLFRFKKSFGGTPRDFWTGRAVVDQDRYDDLSGLRAKALGVSVSELESNGFFPAFRVEV